MSFAPGTTAPLGSFSVPEMLPSAAAHAAAGEPTRITLAATLRSRKKMIFILYI
jgi:hypothetical protein